MKPFQHDSGEDVMMRRGVYGAFILILVLAFAVGTRAQVNPTSTLTGIVLDPSGAAIVGADVDVAETSTSTEYHAKSGANGNFVISNLPPGAYRVTVSSANFKTGLYDGVKLVVGQTYNLKAQLELGTASTTVTVEAGQEVVNTVEASQSNTITGADITHLPLSYNEGLNLGLFDATAQTNGAPRNTTFAGLPNGVINITTDGINVQYPGKSTDGYYTLIRAHIDDIEEVNISSAANNVNETGSGAVQMGFVSTRGSNNWHGGVWEYFRNNALNSNYYFNNLARIPRQVMRYNQYGGKVGGPVWKNKIFFFADLDWYRFPVTVSRTRTILTSNASSGMFTYIPTKFPATPPAWETCNAAANTCTVNLFQLASSKGFPTTEDSLISQTLQELQQAASAPGVSTLGLTSPYQQNIIFNNPGGYDWRFPDFRLDWNITNNDSLEFDYHYGFYSQSPNVFNNTDQTFPVAPFNKNVGNYYANRSFYALAWRRNVGVNKSNQLRVGFQLPPESFAPNLNLGIYPVASTNLGSETIDPILGPSSLGLSQPWISLGSKTQDTYALGEIVDNFSWVKGTHSMAFGFDLTRQVVKLTNYGAQAATVSLGLSTNDPAVSMFTSTSFPGIATTDLTNAGNIYGLLVGRVTNYSGSVNFAPASRQFVTGAPNLTKYHGTDYGFYVSDSWRIRSTLTFNYGLRWQYEGVPVDDYNKFFMLQNGVTGLYGISGAGNIFKPGTLSGSTPTFVSDTGGKWYNNWYKGFAPSVGVAWQPSTENSWLKKLLGNAGDTVLRAGYSIAYSREGLNYWEGIVASNPGSSGTQTETAVAPAGSLPPGQFSAGSVQLSNLSFQNLVQSPASFGQSFQISPTASQSAFAFAPNLHMPYVQSWLIGIERKLSSNTALDVRYVGNHAVGLWQTLNLNEVNIFDNNFLTEFNHALSNLKICQAQSTPCNSFGNQGLPGQVSVPVLTAAFTGSPTGSQTNANFTNGTFVNELLNGVTGTFANSLATNLSFLCNLVGSGSFTQSPNPCPASAPAVGSQAKNFFTVNPDALGGSNIFQNGFQSTYNALVLELRRRPVHGLSLDGSYTLAHALTNGAAYSEGATNTSYSSSYLESIRNPKLNKGPAPFDIRNSIKMAATYQFPFGKGRHFNVHNGFGERLVSGWAVTGLERWQTGFPYRLFGGLGGTINQYDGGAILNGLTVSQLQNELGVYKTSTPAPGAVWYFPQSALGANQQKANPSVLQACNTAGQFCPNIFIHGPSFFRTDLSLQKDTPITERVSFEIRVDMLNAFNNANFSYTNNPSLNSTLFGRITTAYSDFNGTADPGGRIVQLVGRINF